MVQWLTVLAAKPDNIGCQLDGPAPKSCPQTFVSKHNVSKLHEAEHGLLLLESTKVPADGHCLTSSPAQPSGYTRAQATSWYLC